MRLAASLRYALYIATALLFGSGASWLAARYLPDARWLPSGLASASMRIHGAAAMVMLVLTGGAVALHTPSGWCERKNRASGLALCVTLIGLAATGYCLYYVGGDTARSVSSVNHWTLGLAVLPALGLHAWLGRRGHPPPQLSSALGQAVVVENKPGQAGSLIRSEIPRFGKVVKEPGARVD